MDVKYILAFGMRWFVEKLVIKGGVPLNGEVTIGGSKNASLPILAGTLLSEGEYNIKNVPYLKDVATMNTLLSSMGVVLRKHDEGTVSLFNTGDCGDCEASYELVRTMRASILVLGPLLAKNGKAKVALPGGCAIGKRPVDLHISALEKMGAVVDVKNGYIEASCKRLKGADILFDKVTVTGTENIVMAATLAEGETVIENAAQEPEVSDLIFFLRSMGADISGEGESRIVVQGKEALRSANYSVMSDRIEAGTFLAAVAGCGGKITVKNCPVSSMTAVIEKLQASGLDIKIIDDNNVVAFKSGAINSVDIQTAPYPGFPTDMQAQFMAVMLKSAGVSVITEAIFENRFMHVPEMNRMGADITLQGSMAVVRGVPNFSGAPVMASDLRASAGLVIGALMAEKDSEIRRIYHLDRGYERFEKKLSALGAHIERVADEE